MEQRLLGQNLSADAGPYSKLIFDPLWGELGRVIFVSATLKIVQPCTSPACVNCSVSYTPDSRLWYFAVDSAAPPGGTITPAVATMTNVGSDLLTPEATVYVPARGCRPPLIFSYGGAWVNECATTPYVKPYFSSSPWCLTPVFSTHLLRLDTLEWTHVNVTGPDSLSPIALNNTGIYGLGVFAKYDSVRDRIMLSGEARIFGALNDIFA